MGGAEKATVRWGQGEKLWEKWDAAVDEGRHPGEFLAEVSDESIVQLLLTGGKERDYERDLLATEAFNRMVRSRRRLCEAADRIDAAIGEIRDATEKAAPAVHSNEDATERAYSEEDYMPKEEALHRAHHASTLIREIQDAVHKALEAEGELQTVRNERLRDARNIPDDED